MPKQKTKKKILKQKKQSTVKDPATYETAIKGLLELRKEKIGGIRAAYANLLATIQDTLNMDERIILTQHEFEELLKRRKKKAS